MIGSQYTHTLQISYRTFRLLKDEKLERPIGHIQNSSFTILPKPKITYPISSAKPETRKQRPFRSVGVMQTEQESKYRKGAYSKVSLHKPLFSILVLQQKQSTKK